MSYSNRASTNLIELALAPNWQEFIRWTLKNKKLELSQIPKKQIIEKTCRSLLQAWPHLSLGIQQEHFPYLQRLEKHLNDLASFSYPLRRLNSLQKKVQEAINSLESASQHSVSYLSDMALSFPHTEKFEAKPIYQLKWLPDSDMSQETMRSLADAVFTKYRLVSIDEGNLQANMKRILQQISLLFSKNFSEQQRPFFKKMGEIMTLKHGGKENFLHAFLQALPEDAAYLDLSSLVSMPRLIEEESATAHLISSSQNLRNLQHLILQTSFHEKYLSPNKSCSRSWQEYKSSIEALAGNQHMHQLRSLGLINYKHLIHDAIVLLANNPCMANLEKLDLSGCNQVTDTTLFAIATGDSMGNLQDLNLSHCYQITDVGLIALFAGGKVGYLKRLNLLGCDRITHEGITQLANSSLVNEESELEASEELKQHFALQISKRFEPISEMPSVYTEHQGYALAVNTY